MEFEPADGGPNYFNVRLRAVIDNASNGIIPIPKVGSNAVIAMLNNDETKCFAILFDELDEYRVICTKIKLNGDTLGGLVKVNDLVQKLNDIIIAFNTHTHSVSGASTLVPSGAPLQPALASQLENINVKHG